MALTVREPIFWNRFSLSAHQAAEIRSIISDRADTEKAAGVTTTINNNSTSAPTPWLSKQQKKRRKYWIFCWIVMVVIVALCGALAGVVTYLKNSHD
ncbi:uncharacterized protein H6S33_005329 [Morchella sextelata]|uniref:uncharacterized protein n=1 Tax=Morchella sextelata TaxID=1174677 RepID=UPI001D053033|nr:uncharacterized protein H6S33_005329 [Morchella sextelata]KAH0613443.1 hypothetical protein H6S33_005329 [Morchella sextelata]